MIRRVVAAVVYGDELMLLETSASLMKSSPGKATVVSRWSQQLAKELNSGSGYSAKDWKEI